MRRLLVFAAAFTLMSLSVVAVAPNLHAHAVDVLPSEVCNNPNATQNPALCKDKQPNTPDAPNPIFGPNSVLTTVINLLSLGVGVISVFVIIIGGVKFVTSSGDPSSVGNARNTILYGIIALAITGAAQAIVHFILTKL